MYTCVLNFLGCNNISIGLILYIFIAHQHTDARYSKSVCLSVCLSVRNVPVSDENGLTYRHSFFTIR